MPATDDNPEGYWEAKEIVSLNNEMLAAIGQNWKSTAPISEQAFQSLFETYGTEAIQRLGHLASLSNAQDFAIKDPRLCRLLPVWSRAAREIELAIGVIATLRNAEDVAMSLYRRRRNEKFAPATVDVPGTATLLWLRYVLDLEHNSRSVPRLFVPFSELGNLENLPNIFCVEEQLSEAPSCRSDEESRSETWSDVAASTMQALLSAVSPREVHKLDLWRRRLDELCRPRIDNDVVLAKLFVTRPFSERPRGPIISFVSGEPTGRGHIYRIENRIIALKGEDVGIVRVDTNKHLPEDIAAASDLVIIFRMQMSDWLDRLYIRAQEAGVPTIYDIDDLIFDRQYMTPEFFRFLEGKPPELIAKWEEKAVRYQAAAEAARACWVTTECLAAHMRNVNPNVSVLKNGLSELARQRPSLPPQHSTLQDEIVLGYASGTPTHDRDFSEIAHALAHLLARNKSVRFKLLGHLGRDALAPLKNVSDRVVCAPAVDYFQLAPTLARFDVNLAPLEADNPFCRSKSELKFFESGAVCVPSVVADTPPYRSCIRQGVDGYIARSQEDWLFYLSELCHDKERRLGMGLSAYDRAVELFGPDKQKRDFIGHISAWVPYPNKLQP